MVYEASCRTAAACRLVGLISVTTSTLVDANELDCLMAATSRTAEPSLLEFLEEHGELLTVRIVQKLL